MFFFIQPLSRLTKISDASNNQVAWTYNTACRKRTTKDSDGLNHWQLLIQKYFEFLSGLVPWVGDVWIF
jgi:YD repeat-containing protein